ncbi:sensor histidine kinase [Oleiagrimonas soli]|uniref:histidine kinase n=1 Tax=Oleiagrimonas soli TaxID=1543381 RepID=A0A099CZV5_9GAMM|nr:DUF4118 domain-containing protein [Oleiagrimonas soli]KGI79117.1 histidine kinase [Oleiagrimonas soli]MBB6184656.1 two-component system sensor histidine kinase KdpD [Oleiagrimonas soli]
MSAHASDAVTEPLPSRRRSGLGAYAYATLATALAFVLAFVADRYLSVANLALIFLTAVLAVAVRTRMRVAVYTAVLCFLGYNFFFTPPRYTFTIDSADDVLTVGLFLVVALVCSRLATQLADKVASLRAAQVRASALLELGQRLTADRDEAALHAVTVEIAARALQTTTAVLVREGEPSAWRVAASAPHTPTLNPYDLAAADFCDRLAAPAGRGTQRAGRAHAWMIPLHADARRHGVLALFDAESRDLPDSDQRHLAEAFARTITQALERTRLAEALEKARVEGETERLRNALLSSVSHDLRSPLVSMIGAAGTLSSYETQLPPEERRQLLDAIVEEGERLDRYIQNLLDMTRLGHGELTLRRDWIDAAEIAAAAIERLRRLHPQQRIDAQLPREPVLLYVHPALVEQALFNILENAAHVSPPEAPIHVHVAADEDELRIDVTDHGPGIPEAERERIFDTFYSVARGDRGPRGTGLGLSICRGLIGAHGGRVEALPTAHGGCLLRMTLPRPEPPEVDA